MAKPDAVRGDRWLVLFPDDAGETAALVAELAGLLRQGDAVVARTLAAIITRLHQTAEDADKRWLENFRDRYVDLDLSLYLYEAWRARRPPLG